MSHRHRKSLYRDSTLAPYLNQINDTPLLSAAEERELSSQVAEGDPYARERMVRANLRLVVNIAREYRNKGLSLEDLIEEGNLGLMRAVEGYDGGVGVRFSTYASYWIKQSIRSALIRHGKSIRLPAYMVVLLGKWRRATAALSEELGRPPMPDEVGALLGLSKKKTAMVVVALQVQDLNRHEDDVEGEESVLDSLTDPRHVIPDAHLSEREEWERIADRLDSLGTREAAIIRMRFGLGPDQPMTLQEVGRQLNLTRERVRQLERGALAELAAVASA